MDEAAYEKAVGYIAAILDGFEAHSQQAEKLLGDGIDSAALAIVRADMRNATRCDGMVDLLAELTGKSLREVHEDVEARMRTCFIGKSEKVLQRLKEALLGIAEDAPARE